MVRRPIRVGVISVGTMLCAVAAAAGCASGGTQTGGSGGSAGIGTHGNGASREASAHPASAGRSGAGMSSSITLAFAGDVHFTGRTARLLSHPATAFGPIAPLLRSADLTLVNLETAVTSGGTPQPKYYHFRTNPAAFTALRDAGIDIANMANNHVLDYGRVGLP